jgi:AraC-like DNA-binding protein
MRYAAHLLATTNDSVALIAESSGFSRSSFYRIFSDAYGMSPSDYRRVAKKIKNAHFIGEKGAWLLYSRHLFHVLRLPEKHIFS